MEAEAQKLRHCERRTAVWGSFSFSADSTIIHGRWPLTTVRGSNGDNWRSMQCGGPFSLPPPTRRSWRCASFNGSPGMTVSSGSVDGSDCSNALAVYTNGIHEIARTAGDTPGGPDGWHDDVGGHNRCSAYSR
jgi:hypothetical protein